MFSITPLSFDAPAPWEPLEYRHKLKKLESFSYSFVAESVDISSFKFSWWAPTVKGVLKRSAKRPFKVLILALIESILFNLNSNLGPIIPRFRDIKALYAEGHFSVHPSYSGKNFGFSRWSRYMMLGCAKSKPLRLNNSEIMFAVFRPMWSRYLNITDRQTTCRSDKNSSWGAKRDKAEYIRQ